MVATLGMSRFWEMLPEPPENMVEVVEGWRPGLIPQPCPVQPCRVIQHHSVTRLQSGSAWAHVRNELF